MKKNKNITMKIYKYIAIAAIAGLSPCAYGDMSAQIDGPVKFYKKDKKEYKLILKRLPEKEEVKKDKKETNNWTTDERMTKEENGRSCFVHLTKGAEATQEKNCSIACSGTYVGESYEAPAFNYKVVPKKWMVTE